ncbi:MarR family transcriptional regulator [Halobacteriales archaeon SW_7_71_33]|nr:MAG: MarR family transcriptional regulator [Halobacteriales archaeon SW_7_71_33]
MDSADLLDLLGNENRRRILALLARRPYYVTETSEELRVSPKAVIDHLRRLEEAGLVESRVDDSGRKYFHIARSLRLEVNVSPYRFGTKSVRPRRGLDVTRCRYVSIDVDSSDPDRDRDHGDDGRGRSAERRGTDAPADPGALAADLDRLDDLEDELSLAQRWVQARLTETIETVADAVDDEGDRDERLYADALLAAQDGADSTVEVARALGLPEAVTREVLFDLRAAGFLARVDGRWEVAD